MTIRSRHVTVILNGVVIATTLVTHMDLAEEKSEQLFGTSICELWGEY